MQGDAHSDNEHLKLTKGEVVPKYQKILSTIWAIKRKRHIATGEMCKWKARINSHGGQQIKGVHYDETYSPVLGCASITSALLLGQINQWSTHQITFFLAFPQADLACEMSWKCQGEGL